MTGHDGCVLLFPWCTTYWGMSHVATQLACKAGRSSACAIAALHTLFAIAACSSHWAAGWIRVSGGLAAAAEHAAVSLAFDFRTAAADPASLLLQPDAHAVELRVAQPDRCRLPCRLGCPNNDVGAGHAAGAGNGDRASSTHEQDSPVPGAAGPPHQFRRVYHTPLQTHFESVKFELHPVRHYISRVVEQYCCLVLLPPLSQPAVPAHLPQLVDHLPMVCAALPSIDAMLKEIRRFMACLSHEQSDSGRSHAFAVRAGQAFSPSCPCLLAPSPLWAHVGTLKFFVPHVADSKAIVNSCSTATCALGSSNGTPGDLCSLCKASEGLQVAAEVTKGLVGSAAAANRSLRSHLSGKLACDLVACKEPSQWAASVMELAEPFLQPCRCGLLPPHRNALPNGRYSRCFLPASMGALAQRRWHCQSRWQCRCCFGCRHWPHLPPPQPCTPPVSVAHCLPVSALVWSSVVLPNPGCSDRPSRPARQSPGHALSLLCAL